MATHSSVLAWKIPWAEEPGRLQSMGSLRVGHDWSDLTGSRESWKRGLCCLFVCFLAATVGKARARRPVKGTWSMKATEPSSPSFFSYVFSLSWWKYLNINLAETDHPERNDEKSRLCCNSNCRVSVLNSSCSRHTQPLKCVRFHVGDDTLTTKNPTVSAGQTVEHNLWLVCYICYPL